MASEFHLIANKIGWQLSLWLEKRNSGSFKPLGAQYKNELRELLPEDVNVELFSAVVELIDQHFDVEVQQRWMPAIQSGQWDAMAFFNSYGIAEQTFMEVYEELRKGMGVVGYTLPEWPRSHQEFYSRLFSHTYDFQKKRPRTFGVIYNVVEDGFESSEQALPLLKQTLASTDGRLLVLHSDFGESAPVNRVEAIEGNPQYVMLYITPNHPALVFQQFTMDYSENTLTPRESERKWMRLEVYRKDVRTAATMEKDK